MSDKVVGERMGSYSPAWRSQQGLENSAEQVWSSGFKAVHLDKRETPCEMYSAAGGVQRGEHRGPGSAACIRAMRGPGAVGLEGVLREASAARRVMVASTSGMEAEEHAKIGQHSRRKFKRQVSPASYFSLRWYRRP